MYPALIPPSRVDELFPTTANPRTTENTESQVGNLETRKNILTNGTAWVSRPSCVLALVWVHFKSLIVKASQVTEDFVCMALKRIELLLGITTKSDCINLVYTLYHVIIIQDRHYCDAS